jgi:hypothetical protein
MLLTHIFFVGRGGAARRVPAVFDPGKKKPRLMTRRGDKTVVLFSFFPKPMVLELDLAPVIETKFNRLPWCQRASPSTTLYESVKSTDADRLIQ